MNIIEDRRVVKARDKITLRIHIYDIEAVIANVDTPQESQSKQYFWLSEL